MPTLEHRYKRWRLATIQRIAETCPLTIVSIPSLLALATMSLMQFTLELPYSDDVVNWILLAISSQSVHPENAAVVAPPSPTTGINYYAWGDIQPVIPSSAVSPTADLLVNVANTAPVVASAGQAIPSTSSASTSQNNPPTCPYCDGTHRRPVRYRVCRNKHLGLRPFVCAGECGKPSW